MEFTSVKHGERDVPYESKRNDDKIHEKSKQAAAVETPKVPQQQHTEEQQRPVASNLASTMLPKPPVHVLETIPIPNQTVGTKPEAPIVKRNKPKTELEMKILQTQDEHPSKKKDIFKAIFDSSGESEDSDDDDAPNTDTTKSAATSSVAADVLAALTKPSSSMASMYSQLPDDAFRPKSAREINILRNTSPPRGIFSGLIKKSEPPIERAPEKNEPRDDSTKSIESDKPEPDTYGPSLPPPKFTARQSTAASSSSSSLNGNTGKSSLHNQSTLAQATKSVATISLGKHSDVKVIYKEKWIEKTDEKEKKSKKEKKHKKDRDKHKSKKQKKEKHKKKKR